MFSLSPHHSWITMTAFFPELREIMPGQEREGATGKEIVSIMPPNVDGGGWTFKAGLVRLRHGAGVAKLVDAQDLKSWDPQGSYRFDSGPRHQFSALFSERCRRLPFLSDSPARYWEA